MTQPKLTSLLDAVNTVLSAPDSELRDIWTETGHLSAASIQAANLPPEIQSGDTTPSFAERIQLRCRGNRGGRAMSTTRRAMAVLGTGSASTFRTAAARPPPPPDAGPAPRAAAPAPELAGCGFVYCKSRFQCARQQCRSVRNGAEKRILRTRSVRAAHDKPLPGIR